ncbi:MAG: efflux RND transporter permease subunit [Bradymonadia bacterium]
MNEARGTRSLASAVEHRLGGIALAAYRRPGITLTLLLMVNVLAFLGARRLKLDTDLANLLPESARSVRDLKALEARSGGVGFVSVIGRNAPVEALKKFADDLAPQLTALEGVDYVDHLRPEAFFQERALYFLDLPDLETLTTRITDRVAWERRKRNPMLMDVGEETPAPSLDFSEMEARYRTRSAGMSRGSGDMFQGTAPSHYLDPDSQAIVLLVRPATRSTDIKSGAAMVQVVQGIIDAVDTSAYGPDFEIQLSGRFKKQIDQKAQLQADLKNASLWALALMLGYLALHFRRLRAVALVCVPLVLGLLWAFGVAGVAFGTLNLLTAFIGAILMGLGIDHGIHLLGRYAHERGQLAQQPGPLTAEQEAEIIHRTFGQTGRAVMVAALTTTFAFVGIATSEFRAFREFGVIAGAGMVAVVAAYTLCLPALLAWLGRGVTAGSEEKTSTFVASVPARGRWLLLPVAAAVIALLALSPKVSFNQDFAALQDSALPSFVLDKEVNRILGRSQTPAVVLVDSAEAERAAAARLQAAHREAETATTFDFVLGAGDLLPTDQQAHREVLDRLHGVLRKAKSKWMKTPEDKARLKTLKTMARAQPFSRADLPVGIRRQLWGQDDADATGAVLIYPAISFSDGAAVQRFAAQARDAGEAEALPIAGEVMILADMLTLIQAEGLSVLALTLGLIFLCLWLLLGRLRSALICFATAVITVAALMGLLPLAGVQLNYLNVVMIPVLFGVAVDGAVHLVTRAEASGEHLLSGFSEISRNIAGAILTTALGFGALTLADHPGLNSTGTVALFGLALNILICVVGLVPVLYLTRNRIHPDSPGGLS